MFQFKLIPALSVFVFLGIGCNRSNADSSPHRIIFDAGELTVITSTIDKKQKRMSVLFGNALALDAVKHNSETHRPGEIFTLVTWEEIDNPFYYGATINGKIYSTETIQTGQSTNGSIQFKYHITRGASSPVKSLGTDEKERVKYIVNMRPSVFPS